MRRAASLAVVVAALVWSACGEPAPPAGRPLIVTVAPVAASGALPEPELRYPAGSRLELLDAERPEAPSVPLSDGLAAAGGAALSVDGRTVAFVGRRSEEPFAVWTMAATGGDRRPLAAAPAGAGGVAWLPDGRLVVAAPVDGPPPLPGMTSAWALFAVDPEAGSARRITFGAGELDPAVLADGRIVYSQFQPGGDGRPAGGAFALFTVHPDGTGAAQLHGYHNGARLKLLARQAADGDLLYLAGETADALALRSMDWGRPAADGRSVDLPAMEAVAAEPADAGEILVAGRRPAGDSGLWLVDGDSGAGSDALAAPEGLAFVHAVEVAPRPRPQGHLSMVDPELDHGSLLCVDARTPAAPDAERVRLFAGQAGGERLLLGELPLADDGSFFALVPADRPLYLELLDGRGRSLLVTETPIWVRPKEVRACVGCHESPLLAPPNRRPQAVLGEPADLTEPRHG